MEHLDMLEKKINALLDVVKSLRKDNAELNEMLKEKEEEARGLRLEIENLLMERQQVKERVAHLLECIEVL